MAFLFYHIAAFGISCNIKNDSYWIDNVIIERWFRSLKHENIYINEYNSPKELRRGIVAGCTYTTRALTNGRQLSAIQMPLPDKNEQVAIAETLSDADNLIASLETLIAKKKGIKQGVMQELLTGKKRLSGFSGVWVGKPLGELFAFSGKAIPSVFEKCEKLVGVTAKEWQVKNMRTKWGAYNIQAKRIWLNLQLAKKTPECLEYVIIHELVHLLEKNHNDIFRVYMDRFYPNWKTVKANLNEQILDYMEE